MVSSLARHLDLNSLHALSLTCRQFRGTLLLFRHQLVARTLRCVNEQEGLNPAEKLAAAFKEGREAWRHGSDRVPGSPEPVSQRARLTSGRVGKCARDMVGECRRCGTVVCRVRPRLLRLSLNLIWKRTALQSHRQLQHLQVDIVASAIPVIRHHYHPT